MPQRIAVILAGGKSSRMGLDKGSVLFRGERMIDCVAARLGPQADRLLISGPHGYGLDIECVPDAADAPPGPVGALLSIATRLAKDQGAVGFVTAPVDGPFAPMDLVSRLSAAGGCAAASDGERLHPTFAFWTLTELLAVAPDATASSPVSLTRMASLAGALRVVWRDPLAFANINTQEEMEWFQAHETRSG